MGIFRRIFLKCFYCKKKIKKSESYTLQYTASDGMGNVYLCKDCAKDLDRMRDLYDE